MSKVGTETAGLSDEHASLMDGMYRYQRHIYDLTRKYYLLGRDSTIRNLDVPEGGTLLEVGCGTGRNMAFAHRHFPTAKLFGLDISQEMLISARKTFATKATIPEFRVADATAFTPREFGVSGFDRILISYALSMIPDWERAVDASIAALNPGGQLHIVDFGQQEGLPAWFRRMLQSWLAKFHVTPRPDLREVLQAQAHENNATLVFDAVGGGYAWRAAIISKRS
ncbi:methyltransferase domain-containing protein [Rhizobium leguminosarum]|uniref:Methyltransferase domain-containing protein n=1 Tax=Rhizobium leguminosarum TaxID=384 RepID=A0A4Q8Y0S0_RHILE|nr:class I SAM-dependent methyltransferase [Rhizobium leguminosarum]TAU84558.1 methyltransferase domain-containing protein [Rhizobium leguminosarum]TAU89722.1 methyltransferase domain-containing protein [Rhizobium leguminosarum]TAV54376.1 methyltransferase domain-containing protein [Rhizobium leguminosarum]TAX10687.1 methyltransferase domain-containing protein [Rhizobium leguminosarum]TAX56528.1 methyltransferase domain-containing protein [Rhizobium leguminosarum]